MEMTAEALEARRAYYREYSKKYRKQMTPKQKEARRAYVRAWNKANPDKVRAIRVRYWNRKAEELKALEEA